MSRRIEYADQSRTNSEDYASSSRTHLPSYQQQQQQQQPQHFAGVGAGKNAYRPASPSTVADYQLEDQVQVQPDTPSMYTDPFESRSTAPPANILSTRPPASFLHSDPYSTNPIGNHAQLSRSDTIGPHDSVSSYNVPYVAPNLGADEYDRRQAYPTSQYHQTNPRDQDYNPSGMDNHHAPGYSYSYDQDPDDTIGPGDPTDLYGQSSNSLPLKYNAAQMGYAENEDDEAYQMNDKSRGYGHGGHYRDDSRSTVQGVGGPGLFSNLTGPPPDADGKYNTKDPDSEAKTGLLGKIKGGSLDEQIEKRRKGIGRQRWPILSWLLGVAFIVVFIVELIKASQETGSAIQIHPQINPMIGPSFEFLINFGARFTPCMRKVPSIPLTTNLPCLKVSTQSLTSYTQDQLCPIWEICGLEGPTSQPNQSYRFITPLFIHAGFIHILFNLLVQFTLCAQIEKLISTPFFAIVYFCGGIGGFLLGGNFGLVGQPAVGASGAIYACISVELIDLCYNWKYENRAKLRLTMSIVFAIIGLAIGLLPGIDNFSHIGGFALGILGGLIFSPAIHPTKKHKAVVWVLRVIALGLTIGFMVGLAVNFFSKDDPATACTWCRYLSCLPTFSQCKGDGFTVSSTN